MKKRLFGIILAGAAGAAILAGCADSGTSAIDESKVTLKPGTYTGISSESDDDNGGGYSVVTLTIGENNTIADAEFEMFEKNGNSKYTEDYGKINGQVSNQDYYDKAQHAIAASKDYVSQYLKTQRISEVDAISGASIVYNQFLEAVNDALEQAAE